MPSERFTLSNEDGLHARPAAVLAKAAMNFESSVSIKLPDQEVDAKSIMSMMTLGLSKGDEFELIVEGQDSDEAFSALKKLIDEGIPVDD